MIEPGAGSAEREGLLTVRGTPGASLASDESTLVFNSVADTPQPPRASDPASDSGFANEGLPSITEAPAVRLSSANFMRSLGAIVTSFRPSNWRAASTVSGSSKSEAPGTTRSWTSRNASCSVGASAAASLARTRSSSPTVTTVPVLSA
jgi:hypothetical protein